MGKRRQDFYLGPGDGGKQAILEKCNIGKRCKIGEKR